MNPSSYGYWLPPNISLHGAEIDRVMWILHGFMVALFVTVGVVFLTSLIRFRRREGHEASIASHSWRPKFLFSVVGAVLTCELTLDFLFVNPVWKKARVTPPDEKSAFLVDIVAEQYAWNIHYPGADRKFGKRDIALMDSENPISLNRSDPSAKDDIVAINQLHVPVGRPVLIRLSSKDVIHSFYIPVMRVKQDVIPGMKSSAWFEATQKGSFEIGCAQLCGNNHFRMRGEVHVETEEEVEAWMKERLSELDQ